MTAQTDKYRLAWPKCHKSSNGFLQLLVRIHRGRVSWISLVNFTIKRDTTKAQCWDLARAKITLTMLINNKKRLWKLLLHTEGSKWRKRNSSTLFPPEKRKPIPKIPKVNSGTSVISAWIWIPCCHNAKYQKQQPQAQTCLLCRGEININY